MKPAPFHYFRPDTVGEALEQLARYPDAKVMAGGQSLMALMNLRLARPSVIIDIGRLDELKRLFDDTDALILGALVTHRTVELDPLIGARTPLLAAAAGHIGHIGIRNRGTLGGSVAHADPAAEMPVATLVLGATFHTESARGGRRAGRGRGHVRVVLHQRARTGRDDHVGIGTGHPARTRAGDSSNTPGSTVITVWPAPVAC